MNKTSLPDNSGGRSGCNRRQFSYAMYIPERRLTKERRSGMDRRKSPKKKSKHLINFKDHEQNQLYDPAFSLIAPT